MSDARLLYVMGRGHSGSTVLDALLGNGPRVVGVGELIAGMLRLDDLCSCGETIEDCAFWRETRGRLEADTGTTWRAVARTVQSQAHVSRFPATLFGSRDGGQTAALRAANEALTEAIAATAGAEIVVDSSKEFTRALFLARHDPDVRLIHLVRSPHQVLASLAHRMRTGRGFSFLRRRYRAQALTPLFMLLAALGWLMGNMLGEVACRTAPGRILRVRYEDLCLDCSGVLHQIGRFVGVNLASVAVAVEGGERLPLGHKLAGNQMRRARSFAFDPARLEGRELPLPYTVLTSVLTWPLLLAYGYGLDGDPR